MARGWLNGVVYRVNNNLLDNEVAVLVKQRVIDVGHGPYSLDCDLMCTDSRVSLWCRWGWQSRTFTWSQSTGQWHPQACSSSAKFAQSPDSARQCSLRRWLSCLPVCPCKWLDSWHSSLGKPRSPSPYLGFGP